MNFKKIYVRVFGGFITIIILSNISLFSWILDSYFGIDYYSYSNGDGTWTGESTAFKQNPYPNIMYLSLTKRDSSHTGEIEPIGVTLRKSYTNADTIIYRLFWRNPLFFWHWWQYLSVDRRYDFPYKSWEEIRARRPKYFKLNSQWQQF